MPLINDHIISTDGTVTPAAPKNGTHYSLDELQAVVGGYIELVRLPGGWMVVNEEGLLLDLPRNPGASALALRGIVGPVLVCGADKIE